jgi:hypothetical protein
MMEARKAVKREEERECEFELETDKGKKQIKKTECQNFAPLGQDFSFNSFQLLVPR